MDADCKMDKSIFDRPIAVIICCGTNMSNLDASALAEKAIQVGILTPDQVQDGWEEIGQRGGDAAPFLRALERKGHLTPWQSHKLLKDDPAGFFLGGYRILYKIASGSFGRVYRADDANSGVIVAVKVLRRKWSEDKHSIELFEREGRLGMSLRHPNIVEILAVSRDVVSKQYFIVMEFVEGGNLRDLLRIRGKLEASEALKILEDSANGLAYAYSRGVSHRDIKLTNILISSQGPTKLVDFGLAGLYGGKHHEDMTSVDRTVDYAGLEKATGVESGDIRTDIYFLGCVLYEILTGIPPLDMTRAARSRMHRQRYLAVEPMSRQQCNAPPSVFRLVESMMMLDPKQRYQTPSQLLEAIREVRRDVDDRASGKTAQGKGGRTMFIAERDERLQDIMRTKFKEEGFRVLIAADPVRALDRFRQQPFDVLVVDARTTGDEGVLIFERVMDEAKKQGVHCGGVLLLGEDQGEWSTRIRRSDETVILQHPIKFKPLLRTIRKLASAGDSGDGRVEE